MCIRDRPCTTKLRVNRPYARRRRAWLSWSTGRSWGSPGLGEAWDRDPDDRPVDHDSQARLRRAYGRFTRNFVVQGTGAEWALCWIADLRNRLWRLGGAGPLAAGPHLVFFLHDEVVVHAPAALAEEVAAQVSDAAATAAGLLFRDIGIDFPLNVSVVRSYADAGKPGAAVTSTG